MKATRDARVTGDGSLRRWKRPLGILALLTLFVGLWGCDYARMKDDEAVNPYGAVMPDAPKKTVPTAGGVEQLIEAAPDSLINPLPNTPEVIFEGQLRYGYACAQCHGLRADGRGTVGQSFAPLPTDLASRAVRKQSDGQIFVKILLGFKRHPALASTVSQEQAWAVIRFLRAFPPRG